MSEETASATASSVRWSDKNSWEEIFYPLVHVVGCELGGLREDGDTQPKHTVCVPGGQVYSVAQLL